MTCKDCIHYDVCYWFMNYGADEYSVDCRKFKDKSRIVELPFDIYGGDVFLIKDGIVEPCSVEGIHFVRRGPYLRLRPHHQEYWGNQSIYYKVSLFQIGKKVFGTIGEADEVCKRLNTKNQLSLKENK